MSSVCGEGIASHAKRLIAPVARSKALLDPVAPEAAVAVSTTPVATVVICTLFTDTPLMNAAPFTGATTSAPPPAVAVKVIAEL